MGFEPRTSPSIMFLQEEEVSFELKLIDILDAFPGGERLNIIIPHLKGKDEEKRNIEPSMALGVLSITHKDQKHHTHTHTHKNT